MTVTRTRKFSATKLEDQKMVKIVVDGIGSQPHSIYSFENVI